MLMLVDCSNCKTPLQLPPGATSIRCAICHAITRIAPPPPPQPPAHFSRYPSGPGPSSRPSPGPAPPSYNPAAIRPSPIPQHQAQPPTTLTGKKKAVIVGISYKYSRYELKGCINDAKCMKFLLIKRFHFPESDILMLTEEENDPYRIPTKHNIRMAMAWLVAGCRAGDSLVFHYSGHGSQQRDYSGDEADGFDETLCPLDFETNGMIVDDEINDTIVKPLPPGVKLHAIIDACHSGTVLDLPFLCRMNRSGQYVWEDHRPRSGRWKGTSGGEVISFSGCDDDQTSADTSGTSFDLPYLHVLESSAPNITQVQTIEAIERGQASTYGSMLNAMRNTIRNTDNDLGGGVVTSLLTMLLTGGSGGGLKQEPQLTANVAFDVYAKPFSL